MTLETSTDAAEKLVGTAKQDDLNGKSGNDTLEGLDSNDILFGGEGENLFYVQSSKPRELGFYRGQQYAAIEDFTSGKDKIHLPGTHRNYIGVPYGNNNRDTAILLLKISIIILALTST